MSQSNDGILQDETTVTDITIGADGRIFVFGTSRQVIELLADFQPGNARLGVLLNCLRTQERNITQAVGEDF